MQQNHWQVFNKGISAAFRETKDQPEIFATIPTSFEVLGFVHESNGQSQILSRSWNRVYAQAGLEYGDNFSLLVKPWYRIHESRSRHDSPDIIDYQGNFEVVAHYRHNKRDFAVLGRSGFNLKKGFFQFDWSYPLYQHLTGYVQVTSGYGESLIDYNHAQNTLGIGFLLTG